MKSKKVNFKDGEVRILDDSVDENWIDVCEKFSGDVHRVKDYENNGYSALYECFDDDNNSVFYIVEEDDSLVKLRRKNFNDKLGLQSKSD